jgi:hypothetical protein
MELDAWVAEICGREKQRPEIARSGAISPEQNMGGPSMVYVLVAKSVQDQIPIWIRLKLQMPAIIR